MILFWIRYLEEKNKWVMNFKYTNIWYKSKISAQLLNVIFHKQVIGK